MFCSFADADLGKKPRQPMADGSSSCFFKSMCIFLLPKRKLFKLEKHYCLKKTTLFKKWTTVSIPFSELQIKYLGS